MDWNKTKTIFILTFLFLNAFLVYQLLEKQDSYETGVLAETSVEEMLAEREIIIEADWPENIESGRHIAGHEADVPEEVFEDTSQDESELYEIEDGVINKTLEEPFELSSDQDIGEDLSDFLETYIVNGEQFEFGYWDQSERKLVFYQWFQDDLIYTYSDHFLVVFVNEDGNIDSYMQSFMEFEEHGKEQDFLSSNQVLEILMEENELRQGDRVTGIDFGYHSLFWAQSDVRNFVPMYQVDVNDESTFWLHAITGSIKNPDQDD
ncbi:regulatory protein YycI of two-component signal transduction system YycFG [Salsuginibacillus halophilus]|uniref:Regulatory protein YycI of two-component signal transduction system YycFG n=1 Tax=Salsuginibacillus halophilus TaxID=517424 RepID=A0A2P8HI71_9BACI|nr:two-component system regulatory protein YycI [Salsuginibacillus halophilus]PSL45913.1 regulatory protein YycI of two-component signal transduction system YycFG [Salsuginibacillus halophilus]